MPHFLIRRLKFIPITCFLVLLLNFILVNFSKDSSRSFQQDELGAYLEKGRLDSGGDDFSRAYGLNLPLVINTWPFMSERKVNFLIQKKDSHLISYAPYILPQLHSLHNKKICIGENQENIFKLFLLGNLQTMSSQHIFEDSSIDQKKLKEIIKIESLLQSSHHLYEGPIELQCKTPFIKKISILFCETRIFRYFKKIFFFDFGTLRYDNSQKVLPYVMKKLGSSLLLLIIPVFITFIGAQALGLLMALRHGKVTDIFLSILLTFLYAIPIYIMAPLLIEKVGLRFGLPIHGARALLLPTLSLSYAGLAVYSRINKELFMQLLSTDYLLVAKAKGLSTTRLIFVHTFRQALLTTLPLILGSFGFFIGGLIIVENLFEIDGFGSLFYRAIMVSDYNVIVFSALLISVLTMVGYLCADFILYYLDPRIRKNADQRVFERA